MRNSSQPKARSISVTVEPALQDINKGWLHRPALTTGAVALATSIFVVIAPWWNRFVAVTNDGWHYLYGEQIHAGKLPYRDFYLFVPPLLPLKNALCIALFGNHLIVPQIMGCVEVILIGVALYYWLSAFFSVSESYVAAVTGTMIYVLGNTTEAVSGLHQEGVLFPILAGWMASLAIRRKNALYTLLSGTFAGFAMMGKQTSGAATTVILGAILVLLPLRRTDARSALTTFFSYVAGWLIPVLPICLWLARRGAFGDFISEAFVRGSASKGSFSDILLRPVHMVMQDIRYQVDIALAAAFLITIALLSRYNKRRGLHVSKTRTEKTLVLAYFSASLAIVAISLLLSRFGSLALLRPFLRTLPSYLPIFIGEIGCLALFVVYAGAWLRGDVSERDAQALLMSGFGFGMAYALSLSWVTYISMIIPAFSITLAFALSALKTTSAGRKLIPVLIAACLLATGQLTWQKMQQPYAWGAWSEPNVNTADAASASPELAAFRMAPATGQIVDRITRDITEHSRPDQPVFVDPNVALFYVLAQRSPATFAYVHYIDVAPDYIDRADALALIKQPPAVIVYWQQTEQEMRAAEFNFRHSRTSGVRDIAGAIGSLRPRYDQVDSITTPTGDTFVVLAKKRR